MHVDHKSQSFLDCELRTNVPFSAGVWRDGKCNKTSQQVARVVLLRARIDNLVVLWQMCDTPTKHVFSACGLDMNE